MKKETLLKFREEVVNAGELIDLNYVELVDGKPCYCAVGLLFKMAGGTDEEIEVFNHGAENTVSDLMDNEVTAIEWVEKIGFEPDNMRTIKFLSGLQSTNDGAEDEERVEKVLAFIDKHLQEVVE